MKKISLIVLALAVVFAMPLAGYAMHDEQTAEQKAENVKNIRLAAAELQPTNADLAAKLNALADKKEKWYKEHEEKKAAHAEEMRESVATLRQANAELKGKNDDLAGELDDLANECEKKVDHKTAVA